MLRLFIMDAKKEKTFHIFCFLYYFIFYGERFLPIVCSSFNLKRHSRHLGQQQNNSLVRKYRKPAQNNSIILYQLRKAFDMYNGRVPLWNAPVVATIACRG